MTDRLFGCDDGACERKAGSGLHGIAALDLDRYSERGVAAPGAQPASRRLGVVGRRLLDVVETHTIGSMRELFMEVAGDLPEQFTTKDLSAAMVSPLRLGQQAAYCFREAGVSQICGKAGNALIYRSTPPQR